MKIKRCQHNEDGDSRLGGEEKDEIFTSLGLFFAVATPVKPMKKREKKKVTEELLTGNFHKDSDAFFKKNKRTQTPTQCHNSTQLADPPLLPVLSAWLSRLRFRKEE